MSNASLSTCSARQEPMEKQKATKNVACKSSSIYLVLGPLSSCWLETAKNTACFRMAVWSRTIDILRNAVSSLPPISPQDDFSVDFDWQNHVTSPFRRF